MYLVLSLAGLTVLAGASDAFAQRRGFGYGGGWGNSPISSFGLGRGGYYSPYGGYYGGGGYGGGGYGVGGYGPYSQGYGYGNAYQLTPSYYNLAPNYSLNPATYPNSQPQTRQSYYSVPATAQQSASITVLVPEADAQVWFDDRLTMQQGMDRLFHSPQLELNQTFVYTVKARWMAGGQAVIQERRVNIQAGQSVTIDFRENTGDNAPPLSPRLPNAIPRE
jgi:uncharacterized protein (TIGR03000 family)